MDFQLAKPYGFIAKDAFIRAFKVQPSEIRRLRAEMNRQEVIEHPRYGWELEAAARCLGAIRRDS